MRSRDLFMLLQSKQNVILKGKPRKKKSRPFRVREKGGHRHDCRCKMSGDELSFLNENDQKKLMDDQREVNEHRNLSLKVFQIKKEF